MESRRHNMDAIEGEKDGGAEHDRSGSTGASRGVDGAQARKTRRKISKKINRRARPAAYRNSRASLYRRGSGSAGMQANQAGLYGGGFCAGVRQRRYRAADPLHHAYHPGEPPAADRTQAIAESQPATRGRLQSGQSEIRTGALAGSARATVAGQSATGIRPARLPPGSCSWRSRTIRS
jgi:hypothetical protein